MNEKDFTTIATEEISIYGGANRTMSIEVAIGAPIYDGSGDAFGWRCQYRYGCDGNFVCNTVYGEDSIHALYSAIVVAGAQLKMQINAGTFIAPGHERMPNYGFPKWAPFKSYVDGNRHSQPVLPEPPSRGAPEANTSTEEPHGHAAQQNSASATPGDTSSSKDINPSKTRYLGTVIASRQFIYGTATGDRYHVNYYVGIPQFNLKAGNWRCKYELVGPSGNVRRFMIGVGSLDALVLALCFAPTELVSSQLYPNEAQLLWPQLGNFGFPHVPY